MDFNKYKKKKSKRNISEDEKRLLDFIFKGTRAADNHINRCRKLTYKDDEIAHIGQMMYKQSIKRAIEKERLGRKMNKEEIIELLKSEQYSMFWKDLHKKNLKAYQIMSILIK